MDEKTKLELAAIRRETSVGDKLADSIRKEVETEAAKDTSLVKAPAVITARLGRERTERLPPAHDWTRLPVWVREELTRMTRELVFQDRIIDALRAKVPSGSKIGATWTYEKDGKPNLTLPDLTAIRFLNAEMRGGRDPWIEVSLQSPRQNVGPLGAKDRTIRVCGSRPLLVRPSASNVVAIEVED